uniref:OSJNBb0058J09.7 protein n=1 Tax=Oryza sativa subsp. japonica TaxID=39947 RepID=Q7XRW1_ORYSJ|nr:OSJNBb0058J09.7 [Oryza sativa Japonica Group]
MAFSGGQLMMTGTSVSRQRLAVHGLGRLSGVHGNSSEMVRDAAGADDALRAPSSGAPAGVLFKQQDNHRLPGDRLLLSALPQRTRLLAGHRGKRENHMDHGLVDKAQPSQDNRGNMVKKLEKGSTVACTKSCQENNKSNNKSKGQIQSWIKTLITCFMCKKVGHYALICSNKIDDQVTLPKRRTRRSNRKCYGCNEKSHEVASCPHMKNHFVSSRKKLNIKVASSKVAEKMQDVVKKAPCKDKNRLCYNCRAKGHIGNNCPMGNIPKPNSSFDYDLPRDAKKDICAIRVISSPHASIKSIWVPKSHVTYLYGPNVVEDQNVLK